MDISDIENGRSSGGPIRAARRQAGLSQEQLARASACSTVYIRMLERGYEPRFSDVLPRIIEALEAANGHREVAAAS